MENTCVIPRLNICEQDVQHKPVMEMHIYIRVCLVSLAIFSTFHCSAVPKNHASIKLITKFLQLLFIHVSVRIFF